MQTLTRLLILLSCALLLGGCAGRPPPTATPPATQAAAATRVEATSVPPPALTAASTVTSAPLEVTRAVVRPPAGLEPGLSSTATAVPPDRLMTVDEFVALLQKVYSMSRRDPDGMRRALQPVIDRDFAFELYPVGPLPYMETHQNVVGHLADGLFSPLEPEFITGNIEPHLPAGTAPEAFYTSERPLEAIVYSTGWGQDGTAEALLYLSREGGALRWAGVALSKDNFAPLPELETVSPPAGLVYRLEDKWWQTGADGEPHLLLAHPGSLSINREATCAIYAEDAGQTLTLFDLAATGQPVSRTLPLEYSLMQGSWGISWLDEQTAILMITEPSDGLSQGTTGYLALLDVLNGKLEMLAPEVSIYAEPAPTGDGAIFFDALNKEIGSRPAMWRGGEMTLLPLAELAGIEFELRSPSPSPDGSKVAAIGVWPTEPALNGYWLFDLDQPAAHAAMGYMPRGTDANLPPGIFWHSSGEWLALQPQTGDPLQDGVWLMRPDSSEQQFLGVGTASPVWLEEGVRLLFNATVEGEQRLQLLDLESGERFWVELPPGIQPVLDATTGTS